jgi:hypothetical protein
MGKPGDMPGFSLHENFRFWPMAEINRSENRG